MKVIKDTIPNSEWHSKTGNVSHAFASSYGISEMKGNIIFVPIRPCYIFRVDGTLIGEFECEKIVQVSKNDIQKEQNLYGQTVASMLEFDALVRTQFAIPTSVIFFPPKYKDIDLSIKSALDPK